MSSAWNTIKRLLGERFNLNEDRADEEQIVTNIKANIHFKGTNLWTLIFAIFIASIGLNVNSTSVIIGAMLISPLMGPIMGIGLGIGINDLSLVKKAAKNLLFASAISVATSTAYFAITPLHDASSELLARTTPTIWDVFIAFLGGLAGIVAGTRKEKSNVIPGVAIATALMPPLCTAGFGLATGQWYYFLGAFYLFFINSLFICLSTYLIVRQLKFRKKEFETPAQQKRVSRYILIITTLTILPSIYLAYRIVQRSLFENSADKFVNDQFHLTKTQVVTRTYKFDGSKGSIELLLVGQPVSQGFIDSAKRKLADYKIGKASLTVHQGLDANQKIDLSAIKASVLEQLNISYTTDTIKQTEATVPDLRKELKSLYPSLASYSLTPVVFYSADSIKHDTVMLFTGRFNERQSVKDRARLSQWLKTRVDADSVKVIVE